MKDARLLTAERSLLFFQIVVPFQIFLDHLRDGQLIGAARQAFSAFCTVPGFLDYILYPSDFLVGKPFDDRPEPHGHLNVDILRAGLAIVAAAAELPVELLPDLFNPGLIFLGEFMIRQTLLEDLPILPGPFHRFRARDGYDIRRGKDKA